MKQDKKTKSKVEQISRTPLRLIKGEGKKRVEPQQRLASTSQFVLQMNQFADDLDKGIEYLKDL